MRLDDRTVILGTTGSGKTTLSRKILDALPDAVQLVVWDYNHEHQGRGKVISSPKALYKAMLEREPRLVYQPSITNNGPSIQDEFEVVADLVFKTGNLYFFVEEANFVMPQGRLGVNARALLERGRHRKVGMLMVARNAATLDKCAMRQAQHIFVLHQAEPNDVAYLKGYFGALTDKATELYRTGKALYHDGTKARLIDLGGHVT